MTGTEKFKDFITFNESTTCSDVFNSRTGIEILMKEFERVTGETLEYEIMEPRETDKTHYWVKIKTYEIIKASSVVLFDVLTKNRAQVFIEFMKKNWTYDMYVPAYSVDDYFTFKRNDWGHNWYSRDLCNILKDKFDVNLEELIDKNRGKLHGEKFGL